MSVEQQQQVDGSDSKTEGERFVRSAWIEMRQPKGYAIPRELYAKRLINSPIEFGTLSIREEVDGNDSGLNVQVGQVHEIDIAMHPRRGALICGMASAMGDKTLEEAIVDQVEQLELARQVLVDSLDKQSWQGWKTPPVGLFVVAPNAQQMPDGANQGRARVCPDDSTDAIVTSMLTAMDDLGAETDPDQWQCFVALVRSLNVASDYRSALELLLDYQAL